jgi:hypothetical protein
MKVVSFDIALFSPDGKEELGVIPSDLMEAFMVQAGIKSRSVQNIRKAALLLIAKVLENAEKESKKKNKKQGKKKS